MRLITLFKRYIGLNLKPSERYWYEPSPITKEEFEEFLFKKGIDRSDFKIIVWAIMHENWYGAGVRREVAKLYNRHHQGSVVSISDGVTSGIEFPSQLSGPQEQGYGLNGDR